MTQRLAARQLPKDNARGYRTARAVLHRDGHYLLAMHIGAWGRQCRRWGLPGGAIEYGESPEVAVRRELEEELYQCPGELVEIGAFSYKRGLHMVYGAELDVEVLRWDRQELSDVRWFSPAEIEALGREDRLHARYELDAVQALQQILSSR